MRYLIVANGCSTVDRRSLIISGVNRSCILFNASSYKWRARPRLEACVQRDFNEQVPQSLAAALIHDEAIFYIGMLTLQPLVARA